MSRSIGLPLAPTNAMAAAGRVATLCLAVAAGWGATAGSPAQGEPNPYYIGGSQAFGYESNLLQLGNDQATPAGYSKSDTSSTTSLLAGLNQPIGRQRVYGSLSLRHTRYKNNDLFDNTGYAVNGGLDWSTINRISGTVVVSANRQLSSFGLTEIGLLSRKNLETSQAANASIAIGGVTQYTFEGSLGARRVRNSLEQSVIQARNYDQTQGSVGVRWRPSTASNFGAALRGSQGSYPRFRQNADGSYIEDKFTRRDLDLTAGLMPSGLSTYDARVSFGKTSYDLNEQRDFSGVTGSLGWVYVPSGKLSFTTRLSRDTGQDNYAITDFANNDLRSEYSQTTNTLRVQADYSATAKIGVTAVAQYAQRKLVRTLDSSLFPGNTSNDLRGSDRDLYLSLGARYAPLRNAVIGCDLGTLNRNASGQLSVDLKNNSISCFGQLTLQ